MLENYSSTHQKIPHIVMSYLSLFLSDVLINIDSEGCQLDEELISLLTKLFETLLEVQNYLKTFPTQGTTFLECL